MVCDCTKRRQTHIFRFLIPVVQNPKLTSCTEEDVCYLELLLSLSLNSLNKLFLIFSKEKMYSAVYSSRHPRTKVTRDSFCSFPLFFVFDKVTAMINKSCIKSEPQDSQMNSLSYTQTNASRLFNQLSDINTYPHQVDFLVIYSKHVQTPTRKQTELLRHIPSLLRLDFGMAATADARQKTNDNR